MSDLSEKANVKDRAVMKKIKRLPHLQAIRKYCLKCMNGNAEMIRECSFLDCTVFEHRFGRNHKPKPPLNKGGIMSLPSLKDFIQEQCRYYWEKEGEHRCDSESDPTHGACTVICDPVSKRTRCLYFEKNLADLQGMKDDEYEASVQEYWDLFDPEKNIETKNSYEDTHSEQKKTIRFTLSGRCRGCGQPKRRGCTYCDRCRWKRRKEQYRKQKQQQRRRKRR